MRGSRERSSDGNSVETQSCSGEGRRRVVEDRNLWWWHCNEFYETKRIGVFLGSIPRHLHFPPYASPERPTDHHRLGTKSRVTSCADSQPRREPGPGCPTPPHYRPFPSKIPACSGSQHKLVITQSLPAPASIRYATHHNNICDHTPSPSVTYVGWCRIKVSRTVCSTEGSCTCRIH